LIIFILIKIKLRNSLKKSGSLKGEIIYDDLSGREKPLLSREFMLTGKPDRIMRVKDRFIPIEYKSSSHDSPEKGHILQLGAYFILIEENYGNVPFGYLEYRNRSFRIKNDDNLKRAVIEKAMEVRDNNYPHRNHNNPRKCAKCPFREVCEASLV
jgi:CRISPR-associated exonuclease Cas4